MYLSTPFKNSTYRKHTLIPYGGMGRKRCLGVEGVELWE
jgi:hypothetical protein